MVKFIEYVSPHGEQRENTIDRSKEIEEKAEKIWASGLRLEIERLRATNSVAMYITDPEDEDNPKGIKVCPNGPEVPIKVDEMIMECEL